MINQQQQAETYKSPVLSLLETIASTSLTCDNVLIVDDRIPHISCLNSKTWRKNHGWSDLTTGSSHSASRWESAKVSSPQVTTKSHNKKGEEDACPAPPSPPKRQSSVSSTDMELLMQARRQNSSSSLISSSSSSTYSSKSSMSSSARRKFQYPSMLGQLPEATPVNGHAERTNSASSMPTNKRGHNNEESCSSLESGGARSLPLVMPQRQESDHSFKMDRRLAKGGDAKPAAHFSIPLSLFAAPNMPQRQESVSTLGSHSTLSTQDSLRSLVSQQAAATGSCRSLSSATQQDQSFRGLWQPEAVIAEEEEEPKEFHITPADEDDSSSKDLSSYSPQEVRFSSSKSGKHDTTPRTANRRNSLLRQETKLMSHNQQMSAFLQQGKYPSAYADSLPVQSLPVQ